jgi:hypothetical protein
MEESICPMRWRCWRSWSPGGPFRHGCCRDLAFRRERCRNRPGGKGKRQSPRDERREWGSSPTRGAPKASPGGPADHSLWPIPPRAELAGCPGRFSATGSSVQHDHRSSGRASSVSKRAKTHRGEQQGNARDTDDPDRTHALLSKGIAHDFVHHLQLGNHEPWVRCVHRGAHVRVSHLRHRHRAAARA